jgi:hypothetical protein
MDVRHYPRPAISCCACTLTFVSSNLWNPSIQQKAVAAIGKHYDFSERLVRLMCLTARRQQPDSPSRPRDRAGLTVRHRRRHLDVEAGAGGNGMNGSFNLESVTSVQLDKDDADLMNLVDDDSMELYLQVQNTVNYFSTDQTQKGELFPRTRSR